MEVMIASFLVLLVFFGLAQTHQRGRALLSMSETHRQATIIAGTSLDALRSETHYRDLAALDGTTRDLNVGGRAYTVAYRISMDDPAPESATVEVTVGWTEVVGGKDVPRNVNCTSILGRSVYWPE